MPQRREDPPDPIPPGRTPDAMPIPVEDSLDLHAFAPRDIPAVVRGYLEEAAARGFGEVRLVHGKGIGFQRDRVRQILAVHALVEWFGDAPAGRGHWGATLVRLRPGGDGAARGRPRGPDPSDPIAPPASTGPEPLC